MTRLDLEKIITLKKEELSKPYLRDEAYDFFKTFVTNNSCDKIADVLNIDMMKFLQCSYYLKSKEKNINECRQSIKDFFSVLEGLSLQAYSKFIEMGFQFKKDGKLDKIIEYLEEESFIKAKLLLRKIYPTDIGTRIFIKGIRTLIYRAEAECDLLTFFELLRDDYEITSELLKLLNVYKVMEEVNNRLDFDISCCNVTIRDVDIEKQFDDVLKEAGQAKGILNVFNKIKKFICDIEKEESKYNENRNRELRGIDNALKKLDIALTKKEIVNAREIIKSLKAEDVKYAFLRVIYKHNMRYYEGLEEEYSDLKKNDNSNYKILLEENNIKIDFDMIDEIKQNSLDEFKKILNCITKIGLEDDEVIDILKNTSLRETLAVMEYIDKGILSKEFVSNNRDIFYIGSLKFTAFLENIKILETFGINPYLFRESVLVLFADREVLYNNLVVLANYDLLRLLKTTSDYRFLKDNHLSWRIDKLLELGYETFIEEDLGLLNYDNLKRLEVLKALGFDYLDKDELEKTLKGSFIIADSELDSYIPSIVSYKNKIDLGNSTDLIENNRSSSRIYNFNGILISINKVLRGLNEGKDLYEAIFTNLNLSENEYNLVIDCISNKKNK